MKKIEHLIPAGTRYLSIPKSLAGKARRGGSSNADNNNGGGSNRYRLSRQHSFSLASRCSHRRYLPVGAVGVASYFERALREVARNINDTVAGRRSSMSVMNSG